MYNDSKVKVIPPQMWVNTRPAVCSQTLSQPGLLREGRHNVNSKLVFSGSQLWVKSAFTVYQTIKRMSPRVGVFVLIFLALQIPQLNFISCLTYLLFITGPLKWWIGQLCNSRLEWKRSEINVSDIFTSLWVIASMPSACCLRCYWKYIWSQ